MRPDPSNSRRTPWTTLPVRDFLWRFSFRHAREEWFQTVLMILILGLGVGTFLSIRIANRAAVEGFQLFTTSIAESSDWVVSSLEPGGLEMDDLSTLRRLLDPLPATLFPVVEQSLTFRPPGDSGRELTVRLLGLDLFQIRTLAGVGEEGPEAFWEVVSEVDHLFPTRPLAEELGLEVGDRVQGIVNGEARPFTVKGLLPEFRDGQPVPRNMAVIDLSALQQRFQNPAIDRVEIVFPEGASRERFIEKAGKVLSEEKPAHWRVLAPEQQEALGTGMTAAFRMNLTVLSLIALLIGVYLIAQTLDATVSRRRREIATLRSLGITARDIHRLWLTEALLYGAVASLVGLGIGVALSAITVEAVTTTVESLYQATARRATQPTLADLLLALALGMGASMVAAWLPARDAASTPPAQFLRLGQRIPPFPLFQHPYAGAALVGLGFLMVLLPPWEPAQGMKIPVGGYLAAFLWLTGGTLLAVQTLSITGRLMQAACGRHPLILLAASRLRAPTSRHQLALSGCFVAIGMAAATAFLIGSFERTVTDWLEHRLKADIFISSAGFQGASSDQRMPDLQIEALAAHPAIADLDVYRGVDIRFDGLPVTLGGSRFTYLGNRQELLWLQKPLPAASRPAEADTIAYANENFLNRTGFGQGSVIQLTTPAGDKKLWIAGIHADYARDNGSLLVDIGVLKAWYQIDDYATAGAFLVPGTDREAIKAELQAAYPGLNIRNNAELKEAAMRVFEQTFAVTKALQLIGLFVALTGLSLSLLSLLRESGRELSLQSTLGMRRQETALACALEGSGIAAAGLLSGGVLSFALGWVLIHVINKQSFGWTLQTAYPWGDMATLGGAIIVLGCATSYATGRFYLKSFKGNQL